MVKIPTEITSKIVTKRSYVEIKDEESKINNDKIEDNYSNQNSKIDLLDSIISKPNVHNTFDYTNK